MKGVAWSRDVTKCQTIGSPMPMTYTCIRCFMGLLPLQAYRTDESVDIEALDGGGYKVGNITRGEFLRYSVDVTADGTWLKSKNTYFLAGSNWIMAT